ncbi:OmpH family outer membrane protein [Abyssalbus ytuae]|uniref:OmpH family outer membrane protein n=1 Tax=Abyssalbus ytuae TaxID=2926907 RepID=A0A9E6ZTZ9_9FLAO|nr:OmpH family outer membrane protein [Abyssalbus ytuae]UOB18873.1 OmpH family outer membrane protein [Abyssalbus ytuae]
MKQLKKLVIAFALVVGTMSFVNAQSKLAHINVQQLLADMPEMKAAEAELTKLSKNYEADIRTTMQELQTKVALYEKEAPTKTDEENAQRMQEVQGIQQNIQQANQVAQQELGKKRMEILEPILKKANDAILKVGRAQGFDFVLDSSAGSGVILADGKDLLADVKKELGF